MTDPTTGEIVPLGRLSPAEVRDDVEWIRDMLRHALVRGVDYDTLPGTQQPTLLKPGAEKLLFAARCGSRTLQIADDDALDHRGVRYQCAITDRAGFVLAQREGYAGYDESRFANPQTGWRADWNNVVQMAQKRAAVAATKAALNASGLFADEPGEASAPRRAARRGDRVPDHVYDDAPESRGHGVTHTPRYGPDPGRPFTE